ncbi:MAG: thioredoxin family protein [Bacteroidaceae bacterium]
MEIKILGTGCARCKALNEAVKAAVAELKLDATITKEEDMLKILTYNVKHLPALMVDDQVVSAGKVLSTNEVKVLLSK